MASPRALRPLDGQKPKVDSIIFIEILAMSHFVVGQSWFEVKKKSLFQFCDLKTDLHIWVHAFPCRKVSHLFPLILIEILAMSYFVVGQS
jgi:hypothetical protein